MLPGIGSKWRHYKSKGGDDHTYEVIGVFVHSETHEPMVVYRPLYEVPEDSWVYGFPGAVRPLSIWYDMVEYEGKMVQRFT
ncbi:DUF1653 domain-containing protein, partial [Candidatus Gracilibacteria bacterium]|nr:DUF1653 domain-containing protein [Candidatus Gracilibacteria bacterium]